MSLQEQLLKLGVADRKQLRQAQHAQRQAAKSGDNEARQLAEERSRQQKEQQQQRQRDLNQERARKEQEAAARQMMLQQEVARQSGEAVCHVRVGQQLRKVRLQESQYQAVCAGDLRWGLLDDRLLLLNAAAAIAIAERAEHLILPQQVATVEVVAGYEDPRYQIPDDLMW